MKRFYFVLAIILAAPLWVSGQATCATAAAIACGGSATGTTAGAATAGAICGSTAPLFGAGANWYAFTGNDQVITASTCNAGTTFDSQILIYTGTCASLSCLNGNNNGASASCGTNLSEITFLADLGTTYYIVVTGTFGASGPYQLDVTCTAPTISNDPCSGAIDLVCGAPATGTTIGSYVDAATLCGGDVIPSTSGGVWYHWTGNGDVVNATLCGSTYETQLVVYTGSCGALTCEDGNADFCAGQSQVTFASTIGTEYYFLIFGESGLEGTFTFELECTPPTGGDLCADAFVVTCGGSYAGSTVGAGADAPPFCDTGNGTGGGIWYQFVGNGDYITASLCDSDYDTRIRVYDGTCGALSCVEGNDDFGGCSNGTNSQVSFLSTPGTTYYILVHGFSSEEGLYSLNISCGPFLYTTGDCSGAQETCTDNLLNPLAPNSGNFADLNSGNDGCLAGEHKTKWFVFSTLPQLDLPNGSDCLIDFTILTGGADYDFAVWGPYTSQAAGCQEIADGDDPLRCSWAAGTGDTGILGMGPETSEGAGGDRFVNGIMSDGGDYYILVVDNWSQNDVTFGLDFAASSEGCLDCTFLPIELLSFSGYALEGKNVLEWTTAIEINNDFFTIERSRDAIDFHPIGTMSGAGNSSHALSYSMVDDDPLPGTNYYRLKQTDFDGAWETFNTIAIDSDDPLQNFTLFPNPGTDIITIISTEGGIEQTTLLTIHDARGFVVDQLTLNPQQMKFEVSHLATGMYLVNMTNDRTSETLTFIKH